MWVGRTLERRGRGLEWTLRAGSLGGLCSGSWEWDSQALVPWSLGASGVCGLRFPVCPPVDPPRPPSPEGDPLRRGAWSNSLGVLMGAPYVQGPQRWLPAWPGLGMGSWDT